jgi:hypothetical protein
MALFKTTSAKLTASYVALFFISMAVLFAIATVMLDQALRSQIDLRLTAEMQDLVAEPVLQDAITERLNLKKGLKYRLTTKTGRCLPVICPMLAPGKASSTQAFRTMRKQRCQIICGSWAKPLATTRC